MIVTKLIRCGNPSCSAYVVASPGALARMLKLMGWRFVAELGDDEERAWCPRCFGDMA